MIIRFSSIRLWWAKHITSPEKVRKVEPLPPIKLTAQAAQQSVSPADGPVLWVWACATMTEGSSYLNNINYIRTSGW